MTTADDSSVDPIGAIDDILSVPETPMTAGVRPSQPVTPPGVVPQPQPAELDDDLERAELLALDDNGNPDVADIVGDQARASNARTAIYDAAAGGSPIALAIERARKDRTELDAALNVIRTTSEPSDDDESVTGV